MLAYKERSIGKLLHTYTTANQQNVFRLTVKAIWRVRYNHLVRNFTELSRVKSFHIHFCIGPIASVAQMFSDAMCHQVVWCQNGAPHWTRVLRRSVVLCLHLLSTRHVAGYVCIGSTQQSPVVICLFRVKDKCTPGMNLHYQILMDRPIDLIWQKSSSQATYNIPPFCNHSSNLVKAGGS